MGTVQRAVSNFTESLEVGHTIRLNHVGCPAGKDSRGRLYITRPESNTEILLAYCHNCSSSGVSSYKGNVFKSKAHLPIVEYAENKTQVNRSPVSAKEYYDNLNSLTKNLSCNLANLYNCADSSYVRKLNPRIDYTSMYIHVPIFDDSNKIIGTNGRYIGTGCSPKYLLNTPKDWDRASVYLPDSITGFTVPIVIVEDQISAYAVSASGYIGVCIYGTNFPAELMYKTYKTLTKERNIADNSPLIVWLDNDKQMILDKASKLARTAELIGIPSTVVTTVDLQPKKLLQYQIELVIEAIR